MVNDKTISEGRNVQHVQEGGFGGSDLVSRLDKLDVVQDFNRTLGDLGWDSQSLEERGLLGSEGRVLGGNCDVQWSDGSGLGRSGNLVFLDDLTHIVQLSLGEDEAYVAPDVWQQLLEVGVLLEVSPDGLPHHGVLTHKNDCRTSKGNPDFLHLLGSDIVSTDNQTPGVLIQELLL